LISDFVVLVLGSVFASAYAAAFTKFSSILLSMKGCW